MKGTSKSFSIRSYRKGDEEALSRLFNEYSAGYFGPGPVTAEAWREQFRVQDWNGPSVEADGDCARLAEQDGELLGYAVTDYDPMWLSGGALIQELCLAEGGEAGEIAEALVADAEERARERGKSFVAIHFPEEEARAAAGSAVRGYHVPSDCDEVFMAAITDLGRFLSETSGELSRRLGESEFRSWRGTVRVAGDISGRESQSCDLRLADGVVEVGPAAEAPDVSATAAPDALALLLMGRHGAAGLYLRDELLVSARGDVEAIALLEALFPRVPAFLPRGQWW